MAPARRLMTSRARSAVKVKRIERTPRPLISDRTRIEGRQQRSDASRKLTKKSALRNDRVQSAPIPDNEKDRINRLKLYRILDTPPEDAFDRVTRIVAETIDVPIALVSLIDGERQWFKSKYGLDAAWASRDDGFVRTPS